MKKLFLVIITLVVAFASARADVTMESGYYAFSLNTSSGRAVCVGLSTLGMTSKPKTIIIPKSVIYNGLTYTVYKVAPGAFTGNTHIQTVEITSSLNTVDTEAFKGCTSLTNLTINGKTIGMSAFEGCTALTNVNLLDGVTYILSRAFAGTAITELSLPATLAKDGIVYDACNNCTGFTKYTVAASNPYYSAVEGVLMDKSQTTVIRNPVGMLMRDWMKNLPLTCKSIGSYAFADGCSVDTHSWGVNIPYGIESIGSYAFQNARNIGALAIPSSVTEIGESAFINTTINTYEIGSSKPPLLENNVFDGATQNYLNVPVNAWKAYANRSYWRDFKSIKAGGADIFSNTYGESGGYIVTKPATESSRGEVQMVYASLTVWATEIPTVVTDRGLKYNVTSLGDSVFAGNTTLTSVTLPEAITSVPKDAFKNCSELTHCNLSNATSVGDSAFYYCAKLTKFTFNKYLTRIGDYAFCRSGITGSVNLYHPIYGCALGVRAFYGCPNLTELIVFGSTMGNSVFGGVDMRDDFRCYVAHPYVARWRTEALNWSAGTRAASRIMPFFVSGKTSAIMSMPDGVTNPVGCVLPTGAESDGELRFFAVTGYNRWLGGELKTAELSAGTALRAGEAVLITGITPNRVYRMGVPTTTPAAISGNLLVANPKATATEVTLTDDSYCYRYRPDEEDFYRYYSNFNAPFGGGYLRDTGKNTQNTIVNADVLCYPLMVASTRVKPANAGNITSSYIKSGTASYDAEANVLTLDNISIETGASTGGMALMQQGLTIRLKGDNTITLTGGDNNYYVGATLEECSDVTITGGGSLTLGGGNNGNTMFLMTHQPSESVMLTIKDCTVNASPFSDDYKENLTVDNATLRGKQLSIGRQLVLKDSYVSQPAGAEFENGMLTVGGQYWYGEFEILPSGGMRGDVNGDGQVNAGDVSELYAIILGTDTTNAGKADLNGDNNINAGDISELYSIILAK
ncbi:MAG: leucine-rich repeat protein [Muribaculaceae bacterium]|nr:leucine-rich repeat protein [Muribaculaceae bacterium]